MSSINPASNVANVYRPAYTKTAARPQPAGEAYSPNNVDKLELSNIDHLLTRLKTNDVRVDKVTDIKAQIAAGTYETDEKLNATVDKLLDEVI
jgi:negative regulator of flagellin synthesis FlgM